MSVLQALLDARLALASTHNCLTTDRPDLPRAPDTGWTTDFLREIAAIDAAVLMLCGEVRTCRECRGCSTHLANVPHIDPAKCAPEHLGSRSPYGERS